MTPTNPPRTDPRQSWAVTRALIRSDFARLLPMMNGPTLAKKAFWFLLPSFQGLLLYRVSRYMYLAGWRNCANLLHLFSLYATRIDIPPRTALGGGCLLGHPPIVLCGRIGDRFTFNGLGGIGGGFGSEDIGGGAGLPMIGDDVTVAFKASVLGPVRVGNNTRVGPGALVTRDVPAGSLVLWDRPRVLRAEPAAAVGSGEEAGALP